MSFTHATPQPTSNGGTDTTPAPALLGEVTIEIAIVAEVALRVSVPSSDPGQAQELAQAVAGAAIRDRLGVRPLAIARVLRDDLGPIAHAVRVYSWIGGAEPELLSEIQPPPDGEEDAGS